MAPDRTDPPVTTDRTGPDAIRRIPPLLRFVATWAFGIPFALLARLIFDLADPWTENLLGAAMFAMMLSSVFSSGPVLWRQRSADDRALRRAVRHGTPPDDDRLRAALPDHLAWLRRGARYGLALGLPLSVGLAAVGWHAGQDRWWWTGFYTLVALLVAGPGADTLRRVRRLERRATGQRG